MNAGPLEWPGVVFFFGAAMACAGLAYLFHRWRWISGTIVAAGCLWLGWLGARLLSQEPLLWGERVLLLNRSFNLLGRTWSLDAPNTAALTLMFILTGLIFILALPADQGSFFYPFGMAVLGLLCLSLTAQQNIYRLLFLWMAANLSVLVLAGGRPGMAIGGLRILVFTALAMIPLLILPYYLDQDASEVTLAISFLSMIGLGILMMGPPFHSQLVTVAAAAAPMALPWLLTACSPVSLLILFHLIEAYPVLLENTLMFDLLRWMGLLAAVIGGSAAIGQRRWGDLMGYAALADWGAGLVALGQGTAQGANWAAHMLLWRSFSMLLVGASLTVVFQETQKQDEPDRCRGLFYRRPLHITLLMLGLLSLAGFPLLPGAAGRWPLIGELLQTDPTSAWVLILSGIGVSLGALIGLAACLVVPPQSDSITPTVGPSRARVLQDVIVLIWGLLTLGIMAVLFLYPRLWLNLVEQMLAGFTFLSQ